MGLTQKYNLSPSNDSSHLRGQHGRLERPVEVFCVTKQNPRRDAAVRSVASNIARLDHPSIPHLIDFAEDQSTMQIVLETFSHEGQDASPSLLDALSQIEQIVDALAYASHFGIAHGQLQEASMVLDPQGIPKLTQLGIRQAMAPEQAVSELQSQDLATVKAMITQAITAPDNPEEGLPDPMDSLENLDQLQELLEPSSTLSITEFHSQFRRWLNHERQRHEARQLSFDAQAVGEPHPLEAAQLRKTRASIIVAGSATLIFLAVAAYFWQAGNRPESADAMVSRDAGSTHGHSLSTGNKTGSKSTRSTASAPTATTSGLQNVGVFNNPDVAEPEAVATSGSESRPKTPAMPDGDLADAAAAPDVDSEAARSTDKDDPSMQDDQPVDTTPPPNPFAEMPASIQLPDVANTASVELAELQLADDHEVSMTLLGGTGAHQQLVFALNPSDSIHHWEITATSRKSTVVVADFKINEEALQFHWTDKAARLRGARNLCNVILQLETAANSHHLNLRKTEFRSTWKVDLGRRKTLDLEIHDSPALDQLYLDFVSTNASLVSASPANISFADDWMMVGLDAAKKSSFGVRLEPIKRGSPRLRMSPWGRQAPDAKWFPIKGNYGQQLSNSIVMLRRQLAAAKAAKKHLDESRDRKLAGLQAKKIEAAIEKTNLLRESLLLATEARLAFRVYRRVQDREVEIARFVNDEPTEP